MKMQGRYHLWLPRPTSLVLSPHHHMGEPDIIMPNLITDEGLEDMMKSWLQNVSVVAGAANYYIGMCNQTPAASDGIGDISTEPTAGVGGYARQAIPRSAVGWPTFTTVNGFPALRSTTETFTASGADFSAAFTRLFLTDAVAGAATKLFSYSGALTVAVTVPDGQSFQAQYEIIGLSG